MQRFAELLEGLVFQPARNGKLRLIETYFREAPDPDRGYGLAALTSSLVFTQAKPALIRGLVEARVDPVLFGWSWDFVGDLAETVALIWPEEASPHPVPHLTEVVETLSTTGKVELPGVLMRWLDAMDATQRWALLKLITGELRVGVSARLAKTALANFGGVDVNEIEELWHGLAPPYLELFAWLEKRGEKPAVDGEASFRPLMLATALEEDETQGLDPADYMAEWKWDGIRVQLAARPGGQRRIFSRTGDDVGRAFPDILERMEFDAVLDGELLVVRGAEVAPFNHLQQRLNRKVVTKAMLTDYPAHVRLYDILRDGEEDLRGLGFEERRRRLEAWYARVRPERMDVSALVPFSSWEELKALREGARENGIEGLMLKRRDSPYLAGRPKGHWFKWKRGALTADTVLMYAQRGSGKRSSYYSDYTFGAWRDGALVPVGKAYFGFTDEELRQLDNWVRNHTTNRFGPVREVEPKLVLEVAFDSVHRSTRHRSGIAMRFPRVHRIRWDKPAEEADRVETLEKMVVE
ncbi:MAG: ATP-dependent ligase [Rhodospirillales bacterium]|jgi:DNA ligase-1|nr:ATP-dependent ligase [Rhodospirillales bacterium]